MSGNLRIDEVRSYVITDAAATLATPGCVTTLVGVMAGLYLVSSCPTNPLEGFFAVEMKRCSKCKKLKDIGEFGKHACEKDGLKSQCKLCRADYAATYRASHQNEIAAHNAIYRVEHRDERINYNATYRATHRAEIGARNASYRTSHRDEIAARGADWYDRHHAERAKSAAAWNKANPDKRRVYKHRRRTRELGCGGSHSDADIQKQGELQGWRCWWCLAPCQDRYHVDHRVPLSKGGHNDPSNIVIACPHCNLTKHDKLPCDFKGRLL